jgi:nucleoside-diphosphate-sugar epimerase
VTALNSVTKTMLAGFDAVIHCAVTESQEIAEARAVNRDATRTVAEAALNAGVPRFIHLSSAAIYDFKQLGDVEIDESDPLVPHGGETSPTDGYPTVYAITKAEAEDVVTELASDGLGVTILRPTGVLGAGVNSAWGTRVPRMFADGLAFPRHPDSTFGFVGVEDLVTAVVASMSSQDHLTANVVGGHVPFSAYIDALEDMLPGRPHLERDFTVQPWRGSYATARLKEDLAVQPQQTFSTLMEEIAHYWRSAAT